MTSALLALPDHFIALRTCVPVRGLRPKNRNYLPSLPQQNRLEGGCIYCLTLWISAKLDQLYLSSSHKCLLLEL